MSAETARKEEPARKRDSCFNDRREVIDVDDASGETDLVSFLPGSAIFMSGVLEASAIPN